MSFFGSILTYLQNGVKNSAGMERDLYQLISDKDINKAKELFQNRDIEVDELIKEYDPALHKVMKRPDKQRKDKSPYITQKLPRAWQRYINEIALFFILAKPVTWREVESPAGTEGAFKAFEDFIKSIKYDVRLRELKRLAGAESEAALIFHTYNEGGIPKVKILTISKSQGYTVRPLFDQYKKMLAFGYGYLLNENGKVVEHFDILTESANYRCKKLNLGWEVESFPNPAGKILAIYVQQPKEWSGTEQRIDRDEELDSKTGDTNNYFADPKLFVTTDVVSGLPDVDQPGNVLVGTKDSIAKYIEPPTATEMRDGEKKVLRESILMDSFTPDFTYENMKGSGTLSGEAIKRALILGYIKRDNRKEIYDDIVDRSKNLILAIMANLTHISIRSAVQQLNIEHEFAEPFGDDTASVWSAIGKSYVDGIISLDTAVRLMGVANLTEEVERIKGEKTVREESIMYPVR
jgi:hypothetical protein